MNFLYKIEKLKKFSIDINCFGLINLPVFAGNSLVIKEKNERNILNFNYKKLIENKQLFLNKFKHESFYDEIVYSIDYIIKKRLICISDFFNIDVEDVKNDKFDMLNLSIKRLIKNC